MGKGGSRETDNNALAQVGIMIVGENVAWRQRELSDSCVFWRRGSRNCQ